MKLKFLAFSISLIFISTLNTVSSQWPYWQEEMEKFEKNQHISTTQALYLRPETQCYCHGSTKTHFLGCTDKYQLEFQFLQGSQCCCESCLWYFASDNCQKNQSLVVHFQEINFNPLECLEVYDEATTYRISLIQRCCGDRSSCPPVEAKSGYLTLKFTGQSYYDYDGGFSAQISGSGVAEKKIQLQNIKSRLNPDDYDYYDYYGWQNGAQRLFQFFGLVPVAFLLFLAFFCLI